MKTSGDRNSAAARYGIHLEAMQNHHNVSIKSPDFTHKAARLGAMARVYLVGYIKFYRSRTEFRNPAYDYMALGGLGRPSVQIINLA